MTPIYINASKMLKKSSYLPLSYIADPWADTSMLFNASNMVRNNFRECPLRAISVTWSDTPKSINSSNMVKK